MAKINWIKALQYYCSSTTVSYDDVAKKFGVGSTIVSERGAAEDWVQIRKETVAKAVQQTSTIMAEKIVQVNATHENIGRLLQQKAIQQIEKEDGVIPTSARDVREWIDSGVKIERQALGLDQKENINVNIQYQQPSWFTEGKKEDEKNK